MAAMILWSFSFIWFKIANETFRPVTIVFLRLMIAIVILSAYLLFKKKFTRIRTEDRRLFFLLSLFEPFIYFIGESYGLTFVSATVGSVIISTIPVFATLGAGIFFRERLRLINYAGIFLSFTGVIVFIINKDGSFQSSTRGLALLLVAVFSAVGYNLTLSRLVGSYGPVFIVFIQNVIGAFLFLPVFLIMELKHFPFSTITFTDMIPVLELAFFASCGAFILFAFSVRNMGITKANVFSNFIPVLTALFSVVILGEKLTLQNVIGMVIVITGIFMSQINGREKRTGEALVPTGKTA